MDAIYTNTAEEMAKQFVNDQLIDSYRMVNNANGGTNRRRHKDQDWAQYQCDHQSLREPGVPHCFRVQH